jgi:hypothetical protein
MLQSASSVDSIPVVWGSVVPSAGNAVGDVTSFAIGTIAAGATNVKPRPTPSFAQIVRVYPNPSGATQRIDVAVGDRSSAINIYDVAGRKVGVIDISRLNPGLHTLTWDGTDDRGKLLPSGVYFLALDRFGARRTAKVVRVR